MQFSHHAIFDRTHTSRAPGSTPQDSCRRTSFHLPFTRHHMTELTRASFVFVLPHSVSFVLRLNRNAEPSSRDHRQDFRDFRFTQAALARNGLKELLQKLPRTSPPVALLVAFLVAGLLASGSFSSAPSFLLEGNRRNHKQLDENNSTRQLNSTQHSTLNDHWGNTGLDCHPLPIVHNSAPCC